MKYEVIRDDISKFSADAIVLPSNPTLHMGSGTAAAILEAAGKDKLIKECKKLVKNNGKFEVGTAVATLAYDLDADVIIHAICPKWIDGDHDEYSLLSSAYRSSLEAADDLGCKSIAFPLLSSGNNHFNLKLAYDIADETIRDYEPSGKLEVAYLIVYKSSAVEIARSAGMSVQENIKDSYIRIKEEGYISPSKSSSIRNNTVSHALLQSLLSTVNRKMQNPEFVKNVLYIGGETFYHLVILKDYDIKKGARMIANIITRRK